MSSREQNKAALYEKLMLLRDVTNSTSVKKKKPNLFYLFISLSFEIGLETLKQYFTNKKAGNEYKQNLFFLIYFMLDYISHLLVFR